MFEVRWKQSALGELANLWTEAGSAIQGKDGVELPGLAPIEILGHCQPSRGVDPMDGVSVIEVQASQDTDSKLQFLWRAIHWCGDFPESGSLIPSTAGHAGAAGLKGDIQDTLVMVECGTQGAPTGNMPKPN